jgi:hypothetical protein
VDGFPQPLVGESGDCDQQGLPDGWVAAPNVHWDIEVDVATFEQRAARVSTAHPGAEWPAHLPAPQRTIEFSRTTDVVETLIYRDLGDLTLVGAVEFVSPANKASPENRESFVAKCDAYLRDGVGLVIVDVVTNRTANLHNELMRRFEEPVDADANLYAASYRPFLSSGEPALSIWYRPLSLAEDLPMMILCLKEGPVLELPLEETYVQTCTDLRISG